MLRSMFEGISGMKAGQMAMSGIANNVANSQTTGYKAQSAEFEELFYQQMVAPSAPGSQYAGTNPLDVGNGVKVSAFATDFAQGNIEQTGNKNDMAIQGDGFFIVGDANGQNPLYTRDGNFDISMNNQLIDKSGKYVMGWNVDSMTGKINASASLSPITINLGQISTPIQSSVATISGNLNAQSPTGTVYGFQMPSYDMLGARHDIDYNFISMGNNTYRYVAVPTDQFKPSASISAAVLQPSQAIANQLIKGDYTLATAPSGTPGQIDITVKDPTGATILTKTVNDVDQTTTLTDASGNSWFTVNIKGGGAPSTATFTIGEAGNMTFNSSGDLQSITGSGVGGNPQITYTPSTTGQPVNIAVTLNNFTSLAADSGVKMTTTDGMTAAKLDSYIITDGGVVEGYYNDGSIKQIAQVALATFSNPSGLSRVGNGNFLTTPNSGLPDVGTPGTNSRGQIKAEAVEASNVDISTELVNMMTTQRFFTANTKVISSSDQLLQDVLSLGR